MVFDLSLAGGVDNGGPNLEIVLGRSRGWNSLKRVEEPQSRGDGLGPGDRQLDARKPAVAPGTSGTRAAPDPIRGGVALSNPRTHAVGKTAKCNPCL
jgi:hypothetical protein